MTQTKPSIKKNRILVFLALVLALSATSSTLVGAVPLEVCPTDAMLPPPAPAAHRSAIPLPASSPQCGDSFDTAIPLVEGINEFVDCFARELYFTINVTAGQQAYFQVSQGREFMVYDKAQAAQTWFYSNSFQEENVTANETFYLRVRPENAFSPLNFTIRVVLTDGVGYATAEWITPGEHHVWLSWNYTSNERYFKFNATINQSIQVIRTANATHFNTNLYYQTLFWYWSAGNTVENVTENRTYYLRVQKNDMCDVSDVLVGFSVLVSPARGYASAQLVEENTTYSSHLFDGNYTSRWYRVLVPANHSIHVCSDDVYGLVSVRIYSNATVDTNVPVSYHPSYADSGTTNRTYYLKFYLATTGYFVKGFNHSFTFRVVFHAKYDRTADVTTFRQVGAYSAVNASLVATFTRATPYVMLKFNVTTNRSLFLYANWTFSNYQFYLPDGSVSWNLHLLNTTQAGNYTLVVWMDRWACDALAVEFYACVDAPVTMATATEIQPGAHTLTFGYGTRGATYLKVNVTTNKTLQWLTIDSDGAQLEYYLPDGTQTWTTLRANVTEAGFYYVLVNAFGWSWYSGAKTVQLMVIVGNATAEADAVAWGSGVRSFTFGQETDTYRYFLFNVTAGQYLNLKIWHGGTDLVFGRETLSVTIYNGTTSAEHALTETVTFHSQNAIKICWNQTVLVRVRGVGTYNVELNCTASPATNPFRLPWFQPGDTLTYEYTIDYGPWTSAGSTGGSSAPRAADAPTDVGSLSPDQEASTRHHTGTYSYQVQNTGQDGFPTFAPNAQQTPRGTSPHSLVNLIDKLQAQDTPKVLFPLPSGGVRECYHYRSLSQYGSETNIYVDAETGIVLSHQTTEFTDTGFVTYSYTWQGGFSYGYSVSRPDVPGYPAAAFVPFFGLAVLAVAWGRRRRR